MLTSFATLVDGVYTFQLPQKEFDYLFCFGVSPKQMHGWLVNHDGVMNQTIENISIQPEGQQPTWRLGGTLDQVAVILERLREEKLG